MIRKCIFSLAEIARNLLKSLEIPWNLLKSVEISRNPLKSVEILKSAFSPLILCLGNEDVCTKYIIARERLAVSGAPDGRRRTTRRRTECFVERTCRTTLTSWVIMCQSGLFGCDYLMSENKTDKILYFSRAL